MSSSEKEKLRASLFDAVISAIDCIGIDAFKRTSFFGSNDPAFKEKLTECREAA